jgi:hypothetical protein
MTLSPCQEKYIFSCKAEFPSQRTIYFSKLSLLPSPDAKTCPSSRSTRSPKETARCQPFPSFPRQEVPFCSDHSRNRVQHLQAIISSHADDTTAQDDGIPNILQSIKVGTNSLTVQGLTAHIYEIELSSRRKGSASKHQAQPSFALEFHPTDPNHFISFHLLSTPSPSL